MLKKAFIRLAIPCAALAASACVSMSEEDCLTANWQAIGHRDGADGASYSRLTERVDQCSEHGVEADITAYNIGFDRGLQTYCTPRNGFRVGSNGQSYNGVCPAAIEGEFLLAYNEGRELHRLESAVRYAENALENVYDQIDDREDKIEDLRKDQRDPEKALPEKVYEEKLADLRREIRKRERRLPDMRYDLDRAHMALRSFAYRRW